MADEETNIETEATEEDSGGRKSKLPIIGGLLAVLAIGGYFATPYIMNMLSPPGEADSEVVVETDNEKPALYASLLPFDDFLNFCKCVAKHFLLTFTLGDRVIINVAIGQNQTVANHCRMIFYLVDDFPVPRHNFQRHLHKVGVAI